MRRARPTLLTVAALIGAAALTPAAHAAVVAPPVDAPLSVQDVPGINDQRAIIELDACSASLVRFDTSQLSDTALMLTNGHCMRGGYPFPDPNEVALDERASLKGRILNAEGRAVMNVVGENIVYGTMARSDMALLELNVTFQQVKDETGFDAYTLSRKGPQPGDALTVNSGYWHELYRCPMISEVYRLKEGDYTWHDVIRYRDRCGIKGGTSGSPVLDDNTGLVMGVNNTQTGNGRPCSLFNPCEIDENGKQTTTPGANYGTQTWWVYTCLTDARAIDLTIPGCKLAKPAGMPDTPAPVDPTPVDPTPGPVEPTSEPTPVDPTPTPTPEPVNPTPSPTPDNPWWPFPFPWPWG